MGASTSGAGATTRRGRRRPACGLRHRRRHGLPRAIVPRAGASATGGGTARRRRPRRRHRRRRGLETGGDTGSAGERIADGRLAPAPTLRAATGGGTLCASGSPEVSVAAATGSRSGRPGGRVRGTIGGREGSSAGAHDAGGDRVVAVVCPRPRAPAAAARPRPAASRPRCAHSRSASARTASAPPGLSWAAMSVSDMWTGQRQLAAHLLAGGREPVLAVDQLQSR